MFFLIAPLVWFFEQAGRHPWLWLVLVAVGIAWWLLGREPDYTKPRRRPRERRPSRAQVRAEERVAFERRSAELRRAYTETKDRLRRISREHQDRP